MATQTDHRGGQYKGATFSDCGKYRYSLWRIWDESKPLAMCIGLNPSTANEADDDKTIQNLISVLWSYEYGGFYMCNLFALISPHPEDLRACPNPIKDNDKHLQEIAAKCSDVIFCWGAFKQAEYRAKKIIPMFPRALCFGKSASGKPFHPLAATVWMKSKCSGLIRFK
jgi:hypothetical protein